MRSRGARRLLLTVALCTFFHTFSLSNLHALTILALLYIFPTNDTSLAL